MRIFISHSSKGDTEAEELREEICSRLRAKGYEVKVDLDGLKPGVEWRTELYQWLATCDAAVLLLTQKALDSRWVRREIDILMWRRALGCDLEVVPILTGGLKSDVIEAAGLTDLKSIELARGSAEETTAEMAAQVVERFSDLPQGAGRDDPMAAWLARISLHLRDVRSTDVLLRAARALGMREKDAHQAVLPIGGGHLMAYHLLDSGLSDTLYPAVGILSDALSKDRLERLINDVRSAWVEVTPARGLLPGRGSTRRTLLLNGQWPETAEDYIDRATCRPPHGVLYERLGAIPIGEEASELPEAMTEILRELYDCPSSIPLSRIRPDDVLYFLIFDVQEMTLSTALRSLEKTHDLLPGLVVVALTGPELPETLPAGKDEVHTLPAMPEDVELRAYRRRRHLDKITKKVAG